MMVDVRKRRAKFRVGVEDTKKKKKTDSTDNSEIDPAALGN